MPYLTTSAHGRVELAMVPGAWERGGGHFLLPREGVERAVGARGCVPAVMEAG